MQSSVLKICAARICNSQKTNCKTTLLAFRVNIFSLCGSEAPSSELQLSSYILVFTLATHLVTKMIEN